MTHNEFSSIVRILLSPWQRRLNQGRSSLLVIVGLCALLTLGGLLALVLLPRSVTAGRAHFFFVFLAWVGPVILGLLGWWMLASTVLQQNHPTFARLVPGHAARLRTALLVAWLLLSLSLGAGPGSCVGAPLAWSLMMAVVLTWFAAVLRWPVLGICGVVFPVLGKTGRGVLFADLQSAWLDHAVLVAVLVLAAGVASLCLMVQSGDARHLATFETCRRRLDLLSGWRWSQGAVPLASTGLPKWLDSRVNRRLYDWWLERLVARRSSPVSARLLAGLGPATHWTSRVSQVVLAPLVFGGMFAVVAAAFSREFRQDMLPFVLSVSSLGMLLAVSATTLQTTGQLQQTRREQALLVLLPGVPRGTPLNRWLGWRMSLDFIVVALYALGVCWAASALVGVGPVVGDPVPAFAVALLPQVAWQWRRWSRLSPATGGSVLAAMFTSILLGVAAVAAQQVDGMGYLAIGAVSMTAALLYCAWRWWRMAGEPTALPMGRLA